MTKRFLRSIIYSISVKNRNLKQENKADIFVIYSTDPFHSTVNTLSKTFLFIYWRKTSSVKYYKTRKPGDTYLHKIASPKKIAEALYIKQNKPSLNVQTISVPLELSLFIVIIITMIYKAFTYLIILKQHNQAILC